MKKALRFVQMYIHISKKGINISLHINLNVLRNFVTLYWATGWTALVNQFKSNGIKEDMRNDNLFFKRVTDLIIPDYPFSINM